MITSSAPLTVLFDVDGTLVDSEQFGHRLAFNDAFDRAGLEDRWDEATYRKLLAVTGGERRIAAWFRREPNSVRGMDPASVERLCRRLHRDKTRLFVERCERGGVPPRLGARRLIDELRQDGATLAVATTGRRAWVEPLMTSLFGNDTFAFMVTGDDVARTKPDPEVYHRCRRRVGTDAAMVAIEDSLPGLRAAAGAGVRTVLVANAETAPAAFAGTSLALWGYGDAPGDRVVVDPYGWCAAGRLTASALRLVAEFAAPHADATDPDRDASVAVPAAGTSSHQPESETHTS